MIFDGWIGGRCVGLVHRDAPAVGGDQLLALSRDRGGHAVQEDPPRLHPAIAYGRGMARRNPERRSFGQDGGAGWTAARSPRWRRTRRVVGARGRRASRSVSTAARSRRSRRSTRSRARASSRSTDGVLVGTANARLASGASGSVEMLASFDDAEGEERLVHAVGRASRHTIALRRARRRLFANVHVGGILARGDPTGPGQPTIDIDADVHQVLADPNRGGHVVAATALGLGGVPRRRGDLAVHHRRAARLVRACGRAGWGAPVHERLHRSPRRPGGALPSRTRERPASRRCSGGLPEWFAENIDSHHLAAAGGHGRVRRRGQRSSSPRMEAGRGAMMAPPLPRSPASRSHPEARRP